ncbi:MAG: DUF342 domain-containing protein [Proteobacteria bacterium]|nr:MAG: DUF342 domain-containing protein [Pseudomonadota bacterium]
MFGPSSKIQMTFNSRLKRVRVEFTAAECFEHRKPPRDLITRVEERFRDEREDGFIETFLVFTKRFEEFWAHIRDLDGQIDPQRKIKFTLGQGGRIYPEIEVELDEKSGLPTLSCTISPKRMTTLPFSAFLFNIMLRLAQLGSAMPIDRAHLKFLFLLLKNGQSLNRVKILEQPGVEDNTRSGFAVRFNSDLRFATLHIFDPKWLASEANCKSLMREARTAVEKINNKKVKLHYLEEHGLEKTISLVSKMQAFGYHMPYDLLIAYDFAHRLNANLLAVDKISESDLLSGLTSKLRPRYRRLRGDYVEMDVDPSGMKATLVSLSERILTVRASLDKEQLSVDIQKAGITTGYEDRLDELLAIIKKDVDGVGFVVAQGRLAQAGQTLQLQLTRNQVSTSEETVDMREKQNRKLVRAGELIAEVRYTDGIAGSTVDGRSFYAPASAIRLGLSTGEGVSVVDDWQVFAERDGLLALDGLTISIEKTYVHKGNVNLASGNLTFDGAVVIEGDVESGATVDVNGALIIKGSIDSAKVRCSGDLEVKGGVNTGKTGYVQVGGHASFAFLESSIVHVKQNVAVQKSITHSLVISGGVIHVQDENGTIHGGLICAWQAIVCGRFGAEHGQVTQCRLGSHHKVEIRLQRLAQRTKYFTTAAETNLKSIALFEKPGVQLTPDQQKRYEYVKKNAKRYQNILKSIKDSKTKLGHEKVYNPDATLVVHDVLNKNSQIWISGKKIVVPGNLKGILVTPLVAEGFIDLDEVDTFSRQHPLARVS